MDRRGTIAGLVLLASLAGCSGGGGDDDADGPIGLDGGSPDAASAPADDAPAAGSSDPVEPAAPPVEPTGGGDDEDTGAADDGADGGVVGDGGAFGDDAALGASDDASESASSGDGGGIVAGSATEGADVVETSVPTEPLPPSPDPQPAPQPGLLTAGDHDDHLNPDQYDAYADRYLQSAGADADLPAVDLEGRVTIAVVGADGAPFAGARVSVPGGQGGDGPLVSTSTSSDGLARLYPDLDALPDEFDVTVTDRLGDVVETLTVRPGELDGSRRLDVSLPATGAPPAALDLALVIDTTGSMSDELEYLKAELSSIVGRIADASPGIDVRVGIVVYRDDGDAYVVRAAGFADVGAAQGSLAAERADGGGDYPEAMDRAMRAMLGLGWRDDAVRIALLVADAPPHADRMHATFDAALEARSDMIHVVPVAASGVADEAQYLMRAMAAVTQARYLFLTDDSGIGLPHDEPDIACYLVTRLDGLIVRTVRSLAEGARVEPSEDEVVRRVGEYDGGRCLVNGQ